MHNAKDFEVLSDITNILHLATLFVPSHLWSLKYLVLSRHSKFFLFMPITFEIVHIYIHTQY